MWPSALCGVHYKSTTWTPQGYFPHSALHPPHPPPFIRTWLAFFHTSLLTVTPLPFILQAVFGASLPGKVLLLLHSNGYHRAFPLFLSILHTFNLLHHHFPLPLPLLYLSVTYS